MWKRVFAVVALTFVVAACDLRADITVNDDGSGTFATVFALGSQERDALERSASGREDPFTELRADLADDPVTWTVDDYQEGDLKGIRATFTFSSPDDLRDKVFALSQASDRDGGLSDFMLARTGEVWEFRGVASDAGLRAGPGSAVDADELASLVRVQFSITLPGSARETNADEVRAARGRTTFVWKPAAQAGGVTFTANTTAASPSGPPIIPVAAVVGVVIAGIFLSLRRREIPVPILFEDVSSPRTTAPVGATPSAEPERHHSR